MSAGLDAAWNEFLVSHRRKANQPALADRDYFAAGYLACLEQEKPVLATVPEAETTTTEPDFSKPPPESTKPFGTTD